MYKVDIKPLSVNEMYIGRRNGTRVKSGKYRKWNNEIIYLMPKIKLPEPPFKIVYEFGFSSKGSDIDNAVKPFQDVLQKHYGFNDNKIYEFTAKRVNVAKGKEYIKFKIEKLKHSGSR